MLYKMVQNTNYIISIMAQVLIPKAIYPSPLDQQNLFYPSISPESCSNIDLYHKLMGLKKHLGAFKLFKQKKNKVKQAKNKLAASIDQNGEPQMKKKFKLKIKTFKKNGIEHERQCCHQKEPPTEYFDPNTAPAYANYQNMDFHISNFKQSDVQHMERNITFEKKQKIIVQNIIQKINSHKEQEMDYEMIQEGGTIDDPFIIIKKIAVKKAKMNKKLEKGLSEAKKHGNKKVNVTLPEKNKIKQEINYIPPILLNQTKSQVQQKPIDFSPIKEIEKSDHSRPDGTMEIEKQIYTGIKDHEAHIESLLMFGNYNRPTFIIHINSESEESEMLEIDLREKLLL